MDPLLITKNKRTSIYNEKDYYNLCNIIGKLESLVVLPNIWTEVDNLLHYYYNKGYKDLYMSIIIQAIKNTSEKYLQSNIIERNSEFYDLGLTDTLILQHAKNCKLLITSDSMLSDYAKSRGIKVFDMKKIANERLK